MQELNQTLVKILSKQKLGLPLNSSEKAMLTLYGDTSATFDTDANAVAELFDSLIVSITDIILPTESANLKQIEKLPDAERQHIIDECLPKAEFVEKYLSPMLANAKMRIAKAKYQYDINTHAEYVYITYNSGFVRRVCVTADSLQALILDVMNNKGETV